MSELRPFADAVIRYWWLLMGTVALTIIGFIPAIRSQPVPQSLYWLGAAICLFFAFFFAWRDQFDRANLFQKEIDAVYADVVLDWLLENPAKTFPS